MADEVAVVAQSDPTEQQTPEVTPNAETPELQQEEGGEQAQPKETDNPEHPEDKKKRLGGWQRKIQRLEHENEYWRNVALKGTPTQAAPSPESKPAAVEAAPKPKMDDFETADAYFEALADWKADQKLQAFQQKQADEAKAREQQTKAKTRAESWQQKEAEFASATEDYADATEDAIDILRSTWGPSAQAIRDAVMSSENGPELLYLLGKQPDELSRIAKLQPLQAVIELGKLTAKGVAKTEPAKESATTPPPPPQTKAPAPPTPVTKPGPTAKPFDPKDSSTWSDFSDYEKKMAKWEKAHRQA